MKFAIAAVLSLSGAAIAASYTASTMAPTMAPTKAPCATGDAYMPGVPTSDTMPPAGYTAPPTPTKTPCPTSADYVPGGPTSGTVPPSAGYTAPPAAYTAPVVSTESPMTAPPMPTPCADKEIPPPSPYTGPSAPAAEPYVVRTSARQGVMYTDENGVEYFQDASGQWYYYPSPTPAPTMAPTPEPEGPGSSIGFDDLTAESSGDNSVSVGATDDKAAGAANGLTGAMAAAAVSPGAGAIGLAF